MDHWDLERRAKDVLGSFSLCDQLESWQDKSYHRQNPKSMLPRESNTAQTARTLTQRQYRITRRRKSQQQLKSLLVPKKMEFQDNSVLYAWKGKSQGSKGKLRRQSTRRGLAGEDGLEVGRVVGNSQGLDLIKYWLVHRQQQNSMSLLIEKIRERRRCLRS